jgi:1-deoxy-D-xylulose 5-phosphate reductoisomerase
VCLFLIITSIKNDKVLHWLIKKVDMIDQWDIQAVKENYKKILLFDSEHSDIFQTLKEQNS